MNMNYIKKYLKNIKLPISLDTFAHISELPSAINTMDSEQHTSVQILSWLTAASSVKISIIRFHTARNRTQ